MYIDFNIVWTNVMSGVITGLIVGGIFGLIGYFIWKKQNDYSKKEDAYTSFVYLLTMLTAIMSSYFSENNKDETKIKDFIDKSIATYSRTIEESINFIFYFGLDYQNPALEIFGLYINLKNNREINMTNVEFEKYISERLDLILASNKKIK